MIIGRDFYYIYNIEQKEIDSFIKEKEKEYLKNSIWCNFYMWESWRYKNWERDCGKKDFGVLIKKGKLFCNIWDKIFLTEIININNKEYFVLMVFCQLISKEILWKKIKIIVIILIGRIFLLIKLK